MGETTDKSADPSAHAVPGWPHEADERPTAVLILADGTIIEGRGMGATGRAVGEVCFNTAMTGYQEILTDPSYAGQIITFTFPHIGNVGTNTEDVEVFSPQAEKAALGCVLREEITDPSNYRSADHFDHWLKEHGIIAITSVDTRALTACIRENGMANAVIAHDPAGAFDLKALGKEAAAWPGIDGADLAKDVTATKPEQWSGGIWVWDEGFSVAAPARFHVVAIDYGIKQNILRCLSNVGCRVTVVPASTPAMEILAHNPDGIFLSNGPGDPAATGEYAVPIVRELLEAGKPIFGICLGHQILGLALGAKTLKMHQGHHGANHPVKDFTTGKVEITSMNHGFALDRETLPSSVEQTHVSLFDGSNCGIQVKGRPIFSVQYHPEASPGPQDSHYLFRRFVEVMEAAGAARAA